MSTSDISLPSSVMSRLPVPEGEKKRYLIYHGRWQLSTLVMMLPMTMLDLLKLPVQINLVITQFIGACIFWFIDRRIFDE
ncbi:MAG: hypothetical protein SV253_02025 [Halobacteria archaeon]|nr:hypothetical protein [Halobacteria archaeon]